MGRRLPAIARWPARSCSGTAFAAASLGRQMAGLHEAWRENAQSRIIDPDAEIDCLARQSERESSASEQRWLLAVAPGDASRESAGRQSSTAQAAPVSAPRAKITSNTNAQIAVTASNVFIVCESRVACRSARGNSTAMGSAAVGVYPSKAATSGRSPTQQSEFPWSTGYACTAALVPRTTSCLVMRTVAGEGVSTGSS